MHKWILVSIVALSFVLRVVSLTNHPVGFTPDEASFGYDAYSILKTGKDQWGTPLPIVLKSFGDYKMPLYVYLTVPSIAVFGLNEFAVRLPNAILGTLSILVVYYLVLEVTKNWKIGLFASFLLAISPWHIPMSRGAFEANLTTFFLPASILLFFRGLKDSRYLVFSALLAGLNLFTYHSARIATPLVFGFLILKNWNNIKKKKHFRLSVGIGLVFFVVAAFTYFMGAGARVKTSGIFSLVGQAGEARYAAVLMGIPDIVARVFNNKLTAFVSIFTQNYMMYLSPQFFFTQGAAEGTYGMLPGRGVLYLIEVVFLIGFLWSWARGKVKSVSWLVFWILVAPIPAALSIGPGYAANRAAIMMPAIHIILAIGVVAICRRRIFVYSFILILAVSFVFFLEDYFVQQPATRAKDMIYGAGEVVKKVSLIENNYQMVIVSKKISEPHIYFAFYNHFDPLKYQNNSRELTFESKGLSWVDQIPVYNLGNIVFKNLDWKFDSKIEGVLLVGPPEVFPKDALPIDVVYYPNKAPAYYLVDPSQAAFAWKN